MYDRKFSIYHILYFLIFCLSCSHSTTPFLFNLSWALFGFSMFCRVMCKMCASPWKIQKKIKKYSWIIDFWFHSRFLHNFLFNLHRYTRLNFILNKHYKFPSCSFATKKQNSHKCLKCQSIDLLTDFNIFFFSIFQREERSITFHDIEMRRMNLRSEEKFSTQFKPSLDYSNESLVRCLTLNLILKFKLKRDKYYKL
jgi:hypothetical protein